MPDREKSIQNTYCKPFWDSLGAQLAILKAKRTWTGIGAQLILCNISKNGVEPMVETANLLFSIH